MAVNLSLEKILENQLEKLDELEMATSFILNKSTMASVFIEANEHIEALKKNLSGTKEDLSNMKNQVDKCKALMSYLKLMDEVFVHMDENIPPGLMQTICNSENVVPNRPESVKKVVTNNSKPPMSLQKLQQSQDLIDPAEYLPQVQDCRKTLFKDPEEPYLIEALNEVEFSKIPKYMVGRQTLTNINDFISSINKVMTAKYSLLALGKVGARKKGELDLYLQFKKEETDVCAGKKRKYFFTADDFQREIKLKLDKTKLNLLTVLRHCKRLQELRMGKNVKYEVIAVGENRS